MFVVWIPLVLSCQVLLSCGLMILQRNIELENLFPNTPLTTVGVEQSEIHCGRKCLASECLSFVYETLNNVCHLSMISLKKSDCSWKANTTQYAVVSGMSNGYDCDIYAESCLKLLPSRLSWTDGRDACTADGASLLTIESFEEQLAMKQYMVDGGLVRVWLGINDMAQEGDWRTQDGDSLPLFTYFSQGQPDDFLSQDCGYIASYFGYMWDDFICSDMLNVLCEIGKPGYL